MQPVTRSEYISRVNTCRRVTNYWGIGSLFFVMAFLAAITWWPLLLVKSVAVIVISCVIIIALLGIFVISAIYDVRCPFCRTSLQSGVLASTAIATGKCGHCGNSLWAEG